jgi:hypothetical protein
LAREYYIKLFVFVKVYDARAARLPAMMKYACTMTLLKNSRRVRCRTMRYLELLNTTDIQERMTPAHGVLFRNGHTLIFVQECNYAWNMFKLHVFDMATEAYDVVRINTPEEGQFVREVIESSRQPGVFACCFG